MNFFQQAKTILARAASNRSAMVIWIFAAAALFILASPNIAHDGDANPVTIKNLATSPVAQQMLEDKAKKNEPAVNVPEKEPDTLAAPAGTEKSVQEEPTRPRSAEGPSSGVAKEDLVVIDKIGARVPIVTATTTDSAKLHSMLDLGAVVYPTSAGFGKVGQTVILGHSAPANWPNIKHDTAFSRINELVAGDMVQINYQDRTYKYQVTRSVIVSKGGELKGESPDTSWLVLVTCWPPGRDKNRLTVEARLLAE